MRNLQFLLIGIIVASVGCNSEPKIPDGYSKSLILLPNARHVKFTKYEGTDQVSYVIDTVYPANEQISMVSHELSRNGWEPLAEDWLNPGLESSHTRGWTDFEDVSKRPNTYVFQWLAQWEDNAGNITSYAFQYRDPSDHVPLRSKPDSHELRVDAAYFPAKMAKAMKDWAGKSTPLSKE